jgi:hypothetical protein
MTESFVRECSTGHSLTVGERFDPVDLIPTSSFPQFSQAPLSPCDLTTKQPWQPYLLDGP